MMSFAQPSDELLPLHKGWLLLAAIARYVAEHARLAPTLDLTTLPAAEGFVIQGDAAGDTAGRSVASAGDVNGDGFDDVIVGAPQGDDGGPLAGEAYVIFGSANGLGTTDEAGRQVVDLTDSRRRKGSSSRAMRPRFLRHQGRLGRRRERRWV